MIIVNKIGPVSESQNIENNLKRDPKQSAFEMMLNEAILQKQEEKRIAELKEDERNSERKNVENDITTISIQQSYLASSLFKEETKKEDLNKNKYLLKQVTKAYK